LLSVKEVTALYRLTGGAVRKFWYTDMRVRNSKRLFVLRIRDDRERWRVCRSGGEPPHRGDEQQDEQGPERHDNFKLSSHLSANSIDLMGADAEFENARHPHTPRRRRSKSPLLIPAHPWLIRYYVINMAAFEPDPTGSCEF